jgi:hypothetical protein
LKINISYFLFFSFFSPVFGQKKEGNDSSVQVGMRTIVLSEVVVGKKLDVPAFVERVRSDSTFYKAFRNLHLLGYTSVNDIRMLDKSGQTQASLSGSTRQLLQGNCRSMEKLSATVTGDFYDESGGYNYYTARMYASLFFTSGQVCGENNIVSGMEFSTEGKSGMEKHREQLKMLFFNPGRKIRGIPFLSGKTPIYDDDMADKYDMAIDMDRFYDQSCYIFTQKVKPGREDEVVVREMKTWFDDRNFEVLARNYQLQYDAGVYDFDVNMEVRMTRIGKWLVPALIRYSGNWKVPFKKRERGFFTAVLSDFITSD